MLLSVLLGTPASAGGDVCVSDGSSAFVFTKPKLPKPGSSIPLAGFQLWGIRPQPVSGSLFHHYPGSMPVGLTVYYPGASSCVYSMNVDETFVGSGTMSCGDDPPVEVEWTPIDCTSVTLP
jgi:hypothetical protein